MGKIVRQIVAALVVWCTKAQPVVLAVIALASKESVPSAGERVEDGLGQLASQLGIKHEHTDTGKK